MKFKLILFTTLIIMTTTVNAANNNIILNGKNLPLENQIKIVENRSYVPLREIGENILGAEVMWDALNKSAILNKNGTTIILPIGSDNITINDNQVTLDYPSFVENGKTYVPIRAIAEGFDYTVGYKNGTITISDYNLPQFSPLKSNETIAIMHTNYGDIKIRFFPEYAPLAVENFLTHAENGYYNGVTFHRVINNFMIQGGDPTSTGAGGKSIWENEFKNEVTDRLRHFRGALAMANKGPDTNGSQFYIVQAKDCSQQLNSILETLSHQSFFDSDSLKTIVNETECITFPDNVIKAYNEHGGYPSLDFNYTVFGQVIEGMDVVDKIASVETTTLDKPIEDIIINSIDITKAVS